VLEWAAVAPPAAAPPPPPPPPCTFQPGMGPLLQRRAVRLPHPPAARAQGSEDDGAGHIWLVQYLEDAAPPLYVEATGEPTTLQAVAAAAMGAAARVTAAVAQATQAYASAAADIYLAEERSASGVPAAAQPAAAQPAAAQPAAAQPAAAQPEPASPSPALRPPSSNGTATSDASPGGGIEDSEIIAALATSAYAAAARPLPPPQPPQAQQPMAIPFSSSMASRARLQQSMVALEHKRVELAGKLAAAQGGAAGASGSGGRARDYEGVACHGAEDFNVLGSRSGRCTSS
jgi:hypothetical protein